MILDKSTLRAALGFYEFRDGPMWFRIYDGVSYYSEDPQTTDHRNVIWKPLDPTIIAAASMLEKLLPGEDEWCHGTGNVALLVGGSVVGTQQCTNCNGSGKVWDEGLKLRVALAFAPYLTDVEHDDEAARAVLAAIVDTLTDTKEGE
jgi:hypothetical protein